MPARDQPTTRLRRGLVLAAVLVVLSAALSWAGLQVALSEAEEHCFEPAPGYLEQRVVEVDRTWWSVECTLDPGNGDPVYTIHKPWQSARAIQDTA